MKKLFAALGGCFLLFLTSTPAYAEDVYAYSDGQYEFYVDTDKIGKAFQPAFGKPRSWENATHWFLRVGVKVVSNGETVQRGTFVFVQERTSTQTRGIWYCAYNDEARPMNENEQAVFDIAYPLSNLPQE